MLIPYITSLVLDVVFHDSLFVHNTQCSMQNVPSSIPTTRLTHPPTPLPSRTLSLFFRVHRLSWFVYPSDFPRFILPLPLPSSSSFFFLNIYCIICFRGTDLRFNSLAQFTALTRAHTLPSVYHPVTPSLPPHPPLQQHSVCFLRLRIPHISEII